MDLYTQRTVVYEQGLKHAVIKDGGKHYKKVNIRTLKKMNTTVCIAFYELKSVTYLFKILLLFNYYKYIF